jgi:lipopolysaccharide transport system permease protein
MARSITTTTTTTTTRTQHWIGTLTAQRAGLKLYQWLWILFCILGALTVAAPRVLFQPVIYLTAAETRFDAARYGGIYNEVAPGRTGLHVAFDDATNALRQRFLAQPQPELRFGSPDFRVEYLPQEPGVVQVRGIAPTAPEAQMLANAGAAELVRQIRAAGGREVLRNLLGWELFVAFDDEPVTSPFDIYLGEIIKLNAFPLSLPIEPIADRISVENLPLEEQKDLTRALESRYDLWTTEINARNAQLDAACGTAGMTATAEREAALQVCAATDSAVQQELTERNRAIQRRQAINAAIRYMLDEQQMEFAPDAPGAVQRQPATLPMEPVPQHTAAKLGLALLLGVTFGVAGVAVDRAAGVMPKLRQIWSYRELIRNLVLRDLRVRYKGSALGYLWTQLAPLLLMLVFWFVFSAIFQTGIAMFPIFLIVALLPWNYCAEAIASGTRSIIDSANLIKKVYFPREVLPVVSVLSSMVNYILSLPMMLLVMFVVQIFYPPLDALGQLNFSWTIAYLPLLIIIQSLFLYGVVLFLSAMAVFFRDTVHLIGVLLQFWFFLTPVFYSLETLGVSENVARVIRWANPMASLVEFYREILYGNPVGIGAIPTPAVPAPDSVLRVLVTALIVLAVGYWFFQRHSGQFGEEI